MSLRKTFAQIDFVFEIFRRRYVGHVELMAQTVFDGLERNRHVEDRDAVLHGDDTPRREAFAVANSVDDVQDRHRRIAGAQEIAVQRMRVALRRHRARRRDERLAEHLTAVDALPAFARARAAKMIDVDFFEIEQRDQTLQALLHDAGGF